MTRSPVRWNTALEEFELRCEQCAANRTPCYWPLTTEFWSPKQGMSRCRACWRAFDTERHGRRRRERMATLEMLALAEARRAYNREWMRGHRARQRAA